MYHRCQRATVRHNHRPMWDTRTFLWREDIVKEVKMYLDSGLTQSMIVNCLNKKYSLGLHKTHAYNYV